MRYGRASGRVPAISNYWARWQVKLTSAWLQNFRRLIMRYERLAHVKLAFLIVVYILLCSYHLLK